MIQIVLWENLKVKIQFVASHWVVLLFFILVEYVAVIRLYRGIRVESIHTLHPSFLHISCFGFELLVPGLTIILNVGRAPLALPKLLSFIF